MTESGRVREPVNRKDQEEVQEQDIKKKGGRETKEEGWMRGK